MLNPMFALVMLTFLVMVLTFRSRASAVRRGDVSLKHFALMQDGELPEFVVKTSRNFSNLFETPVLFYTAGVVYLALDLTASTPILAAWLYVAARCLHTLIHLTYNNVLHRLIVFGLANLSLLVMWITIMQASNTAAAL
jgi:hypothetical protein